MEFVIKINEDNLAVFKYRRSGHPQYLNDLVSCLSACYENYRKLTDESDSGQLQEIVKKIAAERFEFILLLKENFCNERKNHNTLPNIKPFWTKLVKGLTHSKSDQSIIDFILKSEIAVLKKYDNYLFHNIPTIDQLDVLVEQKRAVNETIDLFKGVDNTYVQSMDFWVPNINNAQNGYF
jgi:hypothetical protein